MPKVKIMVPFGPLRGLVGKEEFEVDIKNFREFIDMLRKKYGDVVLRLFFDEEGKEYQFNMIIHNGVSKTVTEMINSELREGDVIYIWPALDGG
jgi:molybdopterin converting factor small subunit